MEFSDAFATGSSIMPQKKNPDAAELIRGKTGRLVGALVAVLTMLKGLPLSYNSDMQEDKEPFFDAVDTIDAILDVFPPLVDSLTFRTDRMRGRLASTSRRPPISPTTSCARACRSGRPTRWWGIVRHAEGRGIGLDALSLDELRAFSPLIGPDVHEAITVEASLRARAVSGGTAPEAVRRSLALARTLVTA